MIQITTHAGRFHADEVFALAFLELQYSDKLINVTRTYNAKIIEAHQQDADSFVVDIGKVHNPEQRNYDHHQDIGLGCAAEIVVNDFLKEDKPFLDFLTPKLKALSAADCGKDGYYDYLNQWEEKNGYGLLTVNRIIGSFNGDINNSAEQDENFRNAKKVAREIWKNWYRDYEAYKVGNELWKKVIKEGQIGIQHDKAKIAGLRERAEKDGVLLHIFPNPRKEGSYSIQSLDQQQVMIPDLKGERGQHFCHQSKEIRGVMYGFIASYDTLEQAKEHAKEMVRAE